MNEAEFRKFLVGKAKLSEKYPNYTWEDLARDLYFKSFMPAYSYDGRKKEHFKIFSYKELYDQLFDENGSFVNENFINLLSQASKGYYEYTRNDDVLEYARLVKNKQKPYKSKPLKETEFKTKEYDKSCYFAKIKKMAYCERFHLYLGTTGTQVFALGEY